MVAIYRLTNLINGKIYIGQTRWPVNKRWARHVHNALNKNLPYHLHCAIRSYGAENFSVCEITKVSNQYKANLAEKYYVSLFQSYDRNIGYNLTYGGDGLVVTQATKDKISRANKGRKLSPEFGKAISLRMKGRIGNRLRTDISTDEIICLYKTGLTSRQVAHKLGIEKTTVLRRLRKHAPDVMRKGAV